MYVEGTILVSKRRRLVHLCETRWKERHESLMTLVALFPAVVKCLEEMQVIGNLATSRNASLLLNSLRTCANIMALAIAQHMSSVLLPLTSQLQSKSLDFVSCCTEVDAIVTVMAHYRNSEDAFGEFFSKASELFQMVETEITVPRLTGNQRHRANATTLQPDMAKTGEAYIRVHVFYPSRDYMLTELNDSFLCHRRNAFALQCLVPKFTHTSSLIDIQRAIELY